MIGKIVKKFTILADLNFPDKNKVKDIHLKFVSKFKIVVILLS